MKQYNVCVVGIGAVGTEMVRLLKARKFPMKSLTILARSERIEEIDGEKIQVKVAAPEAFEGMDFAFFAGTEGAKGASQTLGWEAVKRGCVVIDNGDDFRMDERVPLVIPEINPQALKSHQGLIANPNCSTIIALMPLAPLHQAATIKRIVASTYQAVSGTGAPAVKELDQQVRAWAANQPLPREVYPHQIAFNVLPSVGSFKDDSGESTEEIKMRKETHKILGDDSIRVGNTCVRVPVFNGHSISINVEFEKPLTPAQARDLLAKARGVKVVDDPKNAVYPMPLQASGNYDVLVGRIRKDQSCDNGLVLWCAGDNIWKGAAQNAIQIAEELIKG
ncbi:MAG TPA: aspartate-semialdehyde dehydrogenase [Kiritimatiellia bacterium]|nr:aspartate-semialdehyde dehydrogenase [Kiritimatiellia bacterium]HMP32831.1 aspartate-semialdehyde dehydrogenase [Kiritimatiellia bacterium]